MQDFFSAIGQIRLANIQLKAFSARRKISIDSAGNQPPFTFDKSVKGAAEQDDEDNQEVTFQWLVIKTFFVLLLPQ